MLFCWKCMVTIAHSCIGVSFTHHRWFVVCIWSVTREGRIVLYVQGVCDWGWDSLCDSLSVGVRQWDSIADTFCKFKWEVKCTVDCVIHEGEFISLKDRHLFSYYSYWINQNVWMNQLSEWFNVSFIKTVAAYFSTIKWRKAVWKEYYVQIHSI